MHTILPQEENPMLRTISKEIPVKDIKSSPVQKLIEDMKKLLAKEEYGVALAAVQVGEPVRLFIVSGKALARGARNAPDEAKPKNLEPRTCSRRPCLYQSNSPQKIPRKAT